MTDVKLLFERVLETSAPPLTPAAQTLGAARRSVFRRRAGGVAASALAACAVAAIVATPLVLRGSAAPQITAGGPTGTTAIASPTSAASFEQTMFSLLLASIPPGYTVPTTDTIAGGDVGAPNMYEIRKTSNFTDPDGTVNYFAATDIYRGDEASVVAIYVIVGPHAMPVVADLCSVAGPRPDEGCHVVTSSGGVPVRVSRGTVPVDRMDLAAVAYPGVTVYAMEESSNGMLGKATMDPPVFGPTGLAELAANPDFRPPA